MTDDLEVPEPTEEEKAAAGTPPEKVEGAEGLPEDVKDGDASDFEEPDADQDEEKDE
jgi:hypothetical protein